MKKNDEFIVEIIDLSSDGYGVAKVDGEIVFVPNAITNEKVKIKIINTKTKFAIAKVLEYYTQSEFRTIPKCKYFGKCGGCDLQHIKYEKQLEFKTNQVKNCFNKYANINLQVDNCVASSNIFNYRNKIAIPVVEENGETIIGLYKVGSHNVVEIEDCVIQKPFVSKLLKIIKSYINKNNLKGYNEVSKSGDIKHIVARYLQNKLLVTVVTTKKTLPNLNELYKDLVNEYSEWVEAPKTIYDVFSPDEIYLMQRCVETETFQRDFNSKCNVASVIFNRLNHCRYCTSKFLFTKRKTIKS